MKTDILQTATNLFTQHGFKNATMDEVAAAMGISKKTIYIHYPTKNDLIEAVTNHIFEILQKGIMDIYQMDKNPIDELYDTKKFIDEFLRNRNDSNSYQLQKYYPKIFETLSNKQFEIVTGCIGKNLTKGIQMGFYREDLDIDFLARLYYSNSKSIQNLDLFPLEQFSQEALRAKYLEYHLRGVCTAKGLEYMENLISQLA